MARFLWTQRQDIGPGARLSHAMIYSASARHTLLYGGTSAASVLLADTWEWDGEAWTQVADIGPGPRSGHQLAYDGARDRVVLFGGSGPGATVLGDTWEWGGASWTQVEDTGPSPREGHAMVFDAIRGRVMLFGGSASGGTVFGDTWEWDGASWTQIEDTGPRPREGHAIAFDTVRGRIVLFGGEGSGGTPLGDTWEWYGASWTQAADSGPAACRSAAMAFDGSVSLLFGGTQQVAGAAMPRFFRLTWEWNGERWTARQDMGPLARWGHAMVFDGARARIVLFGGLPVSPAAADAADRALGDTWELSGSERTATRGGVRLASFTFDPDAIIPLGQTTAAVSLNQQAPAGGTAVGFSLRGHPIERIAELLIAAGGTVGETPLVPPDLGYGDYLFEARLQPDGEPLTATLHVPLIRLISFTLDPDPVAPFGDTTAAVRLNHEAPAGGAEVSFWFAGHTDRLAALCPPPSPRRPRCVRTPVPTRRRRGGSSKSSSRRRGRSASYSPASPSRPSSPGSRTASG